MTKQCYLVRCAQCGEYPAAPEDFDQFLGKELKAAVAARPHEPLFGVYFDDGCPACFPNGTSRVRLSVLGLKPNLRFRIVRGFHRIIRFFCLSTS